MSFDLETRNISAVPIEVQQEAREAAELVNNAVFKQYLTHMNTAEIVPADNALQDSTKLRLFKITKMVYQSEEPSTHKFAAVFDAVQNLNCNIALVADSDGTKIDFYLGVRSLDNRRGAKSLDYTLKNALCGHFPGVDVEDLRDPDIQNVLRNIRGKQNLAAVSGIAQQKTDGDDNNNFVQGLEKLVYAMHGQKYTMIILAHGVSDEQLHHERQAYENIYTSLSPLANIQKSYGVNAVFNASQAFSDTTGTSRSHSVNESKQKSHTETTGHSYSESDSVTKNFSFGPGGVASVAALGMIIGGGPVGIAATATLALGSLSYSRGSSEIHGRTENYSSSDTRGYSSGTSDTKGTSHTVGTTQTRGMSTGTSDTVQLTVQNKSIQNILYRIDEQLKRLEQCESLGAWECAAYFLADTQETAEMAAVTYRALMRGEKSGLEVSAVNLWGHDDTKKLREYLANFLHPQFVSHVKKVSIPLTVASLVSSSELAVHMGLPRKSVQGFPVIEHAEFGKEVLHYGALSPNNIILGKVWNMGRSETTPVKLDCNSLTMHTFVTGSTGSGKSNAVYELLNQLTKKEHASFLVIEPAKGEYKNVFGHMQDVTVYGTNPQKYDHMLKINPFRFPPDIHVLEHLDRLVEIFNVCWPMYAAMPAILKDAMERAYESVGWDIATSQNPRGAVYPNFIDVLQQIGVVIEESTYSSDSKGDYSGALCTRVRSLTTGLNNLIFCEDDIADTELFDKNVIVDLSRIGSIETKALIMGILVVKLSEYRMTLGQMNSSLRHVTVLEEAHNLLRRTSMEQQADGANLLGKSVELIANAIAEMRTYGEGFIIVDQSPGMLDMAAIRNTNTKIILRLPEQSDREAVGYAANLNSAQVRELAKLERGVAAIYQNDWIEPVLVHINKSIIEQKVYTAQHGKVLQTDMGDLKKNMVSFLLQGFVYEQLHFDIHKIKKYLRTLVLSQREKMFFYDLLNEFENTRNIFPWRSDRIAQIAKQICVLVDPEKNIIRTIHKAHDHEGLNTCLTSISKQVLPDVSDDIILILNKALMRAQIELYEQNDLECIYGNYCGWIEKIK